MLVVCSDTHCRDDPSLSERLEADIAAADGVCHAGDFTTEAVLDRFQAAADRLYAVHGNADTAAVRNRLPEARTLTYEGTTIVLTHRQAGGATGLALFGRSRDASLVISGHTHAPSVTTADGVTLLNPGSHAEPRGNRPGYAVITPDESGLTIELRAPDGTVFERTAVDS